MDPVYVALVAVFLLLQAFLITSGCLVLARAKRTRLRSFSLLGIFFLSMSAFFFILVLRAVGLDIPYVVSPLVMQLVIFSGLVFVRDAFFVGRRGIFPTIALLSLVLAVGNFVFAALQDVPEYFLVGRLGRTFFSNSQFIALLVWQASVSFRDLRALEAPASRYTRNRYRFFGITSLLVMFLSTLDIVGTLLDVFAGVNYEFTLIMMVALAFFYCAVTFIIWVPPFDRLLGNRDAPGDAQGDIEAYREHAPQEEKVELYSPINAMDVIAHLGDRLAQRIGKLPAACKGLILVSITGDLGPDGLYKLTPGKLIRVLGNGLRKRLESLKVKDPAAVVADLVEAAERAKSLFTIGS